MHRQESIQGNEMLKILRDFEIQTDHLILTRQLDLVIINKKEKTCYIVFVGALLISHNGLFSPLLVLKDFAARGQINLGLTPLQVSGSTSAGRVICGTDLAECVSVPGDFLQPQGAFPPGFYLLREGWVNRPAPEVPLIGGMPTGP